MLNNKVLGVDLGGTKIHAGLIEKGKVINEKRIPTPESRERDDIIAAIKSVIIELTDGEIEGIGVGMPGLVDPVNGILRASANLPGLIDVNLKSIFEDAFQVPVYLNNDANCFVVGEKHFGLGKGYDDIIGLTIGTGFGGGVIVNGILYSGKNCGVGDFSRIKYKEHDTEYYCSSQFFESEYNTSAAEAHRYALEGKGEAIDIFNKFGHNVGEAIYTLILAFDPEMIVIGGSIAKARSFFEEAMRAELESFPSRHIIDKLKIVFSEEKNAAILGAAALYYNYKHE
ncbi:MAG: ROK family protein [Bacteroidota bacterium]